MKIKVYQTTYNTTALLGWFAVAVGLIGSAFQYFMPSLMGFLFLTFGLVGGAITLSFAGPFKTVTEHLVDAEPVVNDNEN